MKFLFYFILSIIPLISSAQIDSGKTTCERIRYSKDRFRDFESYYTPFDPEMSRIIWFSKIREPKKKDQYYIHLTINVPSAREGDGVFLILKNGKKISKPTAPVETIIDKEEQDILHPGFILKATVLLTATDLALLKASPIDEYELFYANSESRESDEEFKMFLCLITK